MRTPPVNESRKPWKLWFYRFLLLTCPVAALLGLLEAGLRVSGVGHDPGFLVRRDGVWCDNYRFAWLFFPRSMARSPQPIRLVDVPADRSDDGASDRGVAGGAAVPVRRYVVLGESAALGDPEPAFGFPRMLQALLERRYAGEKVEVVNTAMTAINSHALRLIAGDVAAVPAAGWLVYAGNNEVVGPFGPGTVFGWRAPARGWVRARLQQRHVLG